MRKIERTIYNFDELSDDVKNELIEKEKQYQYDDYISYYLHDDMGNKASDLINDYFGIESDWLYTYYDLSYRQGGGAMVEFDINIVDLNKKYKVFTDEEIRFFQDKGIVNDIKIRHNNSNYYHEYTFKIDDDYYSIYSFDDVVDEGYNISKKDFNTLEKRVNTLLDTSNKHYTESEFIKDIISLNKDLTKFGYNTIDSDTFNYDIDYIIEELSKNEYYGNGAVYYG